MRSIRHLVESHSRAFAMTYQAIWMTNFVSVCPEIRYPHEITAQLCVNCILWLWVDGAAHKHSFISVFSDVDLTVLGSVIWPKHCILDHLRSSRTGISSTWRAKSSIFFYYSQSTKQNGKPRCLASVCWSACVQESALQQKHSWEQYILFMGGVLKRSTPLKQLKRLTERGADCRMPHGRWLSVVCTVQLVVHIMDRKCTERVCALRVKMHYKGGPATCLAMRSGLCRIIRFSWAKNVCVYARVWLLFKSKSFFEGIYHAMHPMPVGGW